MTGTFEIIGHLIEEVSISDALRSFTADARRRQVQCVVLLATALVPSWSSGAGLVRSLASYLMFKNC